MPQATIADFKDVELRDFTYTLLGKYEDPKITELIRVYKIDKYRARVKFKMTSFKNVCNYRLLCYARENGDKSLVLYKTIFGISKSNRIYSRETIERRLILSKGKFYVKSREGNKNTMNFSPLTYNKFIASVDMMTNALMLNAYDSNQLKSSCTNFMFHNDSWIKFVAEHIDLFGNRNLNTFKNNRLFNYKDAVRHFSGLPYPAFKLLKDNSGTKIETIKGDFFNTCTYIRGIVNNPQNLKPEVIKHQFFVDTLRMADILGRKINGSWSEKRFIAEHDDYAFELTNIMHENTELIELHVRPIYKKFAELSGYMLLKSNKEMFFEGNRQRHCVGTYVNQVDNGTCAIFHIGGYTLEVRYIRHGNYYYDDETGILVQQSHLAGLNVSQDKKPVRRRDTTGHYLVIGQFRGHRNKLVPKKLVDEVIAKLESYNDYINSLSDDELNEFLGTDGFSILANETHGEARQQRFNIQNLEMQEIREMNFDFLPF